MIIKDSTECKDHKGHTLTVSCYKDGGVCIECLTCMEVIAYDSGQLS